MKTIYFVRHGESVMNTQGLCTGFTDTPLTDRGRQQATESGKKIKEQGLNFDVIVSSPLQRAHHTAQHIASEIDYPIELIELDDRAKERFFGELEGKDFTKNFGITPEEYWSNPFAIDHLKDVEKMADLDRRAVEFLEYLHTRPEETILLVSHGAFARSLIRAAKNLPSGALVDPIDNATVVRLV